MSPPVEPSDLRPVELPTVGIVGLGLIGGSVAKGWTAVGGRVVGWSRSSQTRDQAAQYPGMTVVDSLEEVLVAAEIVVLATPLPVLLETLDQVSAALKARSISPTITDVGSVKEPIANYAQRVLPDPSIFVPGHPMAGTEHSGWANADPSLFEETNWALAIDEPVNLDRWRQVALLAIALGAEVVPVPSAAHDRAVATTSHLPHLLAALMAQSLDVAPGIARRLAGPSFRGITRIVQGSGRRLGAELAIANAGALYEALQNLRIDMDAVEGDLDDIVEGIIPDPEAEARVRAMFERIDLTALLDPPTKEFNRPFDREQLRAVGRRRGAISGFTPDDRMLTIEPTDDPTRSS